MWAPALTNTLCSPTNMDFAPPFIPYRPPSYTCASLSAPKNTRLYSANTLHTSFARWTMPLIDSDSSTPAQVSQLPSLDEEIISTGSIPSSTRLGDVESKRCGWCGTSNTSQWRVGTCTAPARSQRAHSQLPPLRSCLPAAPAALDVLCNACGLSYRRALKKIGGGLDLTALARSAAQPRQSIHKTLKRRLRLTGTHLHRMSSPNAREGRCDPLSNTEFERPRPLRLPPFNALLSDIGLQACSTQQGNLSQQRQVLHWLAVCLYKKITTYSSFSFWKYYATHTVFAVWKGWDGHR